MEFNVSLLPHNSSNKRHYLIEITDEVTVWSVEKRYQEIYDLKKHLSEKNNFKFTSFPSKCLVNSYRADILSYRLTGFKTFFGIISQHTHMLQSEAIKNFIRTNIYLETFENIRQADQLRDSFIKSKDLEIKVASLLEDCDFLDQEITSLTHKNNILVRNIKEIKNKNSENLQLFEQAKILKLQSSREKNKSIYHCNELEDTYIQLKRQIILVKILKSNSKDRLTSMQTKTLELEAELIAINELVNKISDPVLKDKYNLEDYQAINRLYQDKIKDQLELLNNSSYK